MTTGTITSSSLIWSRKEEVTTTMGQCYDFDMAKYKIIREDWFDHEDTTEGYYDSLEEAQKALAEIHKRQESITGPKDIYSLYEIPPDGHEPMSYAEWLGIEDYGHHGL